MNGHILTITVIGCMAGALVSGCDKTSERKVGDARESIGQAKEELKDARTAYLAEWETFKHESALAVAENEKRIDAFKAKMDKAGTKVNAKLSKEVALLEQKNRDLKAKLEEYKDEGQGKWEEFKTNFKHDMDGVGKTMSDLFKDNG